MRRTIREKEPPRPRPRLSTLAGEELTTTAQTSPDRRAETHPPAPRRPGLDRDEGLEKDRTRRYETANGLPPISSAISTTNRSSPARRAALIGFKSWCEEIKLFSPLGAVAAALIIGLALSLYLFAREREAHRRVAASEKEQARLRLLAEAGLKAEARLREQAEIGKKYSDVGLLLSQRRFADAETAVNELPPHPAEASIFSVLGMVHGAREEWPQALTNFSKVIKFIPSDHSAYHYVAALLIQTGDLEGYRRHRDEILRQFAQSSDPVTAERVVRDCLILPPPAADLPVLSKMADVALAASANKPRPVLRVCQGVGRLPPRQVR